MLSYSSKSTFEDEDLKKLTSSNHLLINYANGLRMVMRTKPSQSNFRVLCILGMNHTKTKSDKLLYLTVIYN